MRTFSLLGAMAALCLPLLTSPSLATPSLATEPGPRLVDHLVVTAESHPDLPLSEVSGLVWDAGASVLRAISDRNRLYEVSLGSDPDRINLTMVAEHRLSDEAGERLRGRYFSAEGIAMPAPSEATDAVAILSEMPPRLALFDTRGRRLREMALAPVLRDPAALRSEGNGVESLTLHPVLGYLVAPEAPLAGLSRRTHVIYGAEGPVVAYHTGANDKTSIKAMETLPDGRLLILERDRIDEVTIRTFLRIVDPALCRLESPCTPPALPLHLPPPQDADFEGIALLGGNRVLIVSDDRIDGKVRTVLALIDLGPAG